MSCDEGHVRCYDTSGYHEDFFWGYLIMCVMRYHNTSVFSQKLRLREVKLLPKPTQLVGRAGIPGYLFRYLNICLLCEKLLHNVMT